MRVVSLLPSATEILFAVGAGDDVVGVTHECDHPAAAAGLPALTSDLLPTAGADPATVDRHVRAGVHGGSGLYALDEARLAALRPDLVVTQELCEVCAVSYRRVAAAVRRLEGDVAVLSLEPESVGEVLDTVTAVGEAVGRPAQAAAAVAGLRRRIDAVAAAPRPSPLPRVACLEWTNPLMASGHWVPEMVRLAGGVDAVGREGARSEVVAWDDVLAAAPDVLVLMPCGYGLERSLELAATVLARPGADRLPAVASGRVAAVDGSGLFNRPGPRLADGLELLAAILRATPGTPLPEGGAWVDTAAGSARRVAPAPSTAPVTAVPA